MSKNGSIRYQIEKELKSMCRFGKSRYEAKKYHTAYKYIYSFNTMKTYIKQDNYIVNWAKDNGIKLKSIDDIREHGDEWLQWSVEQGQSPWTVSTKRSALCKLCQVPYSYFKTKIPPKRRQDIKRSRNMEKSLKHFSEQRNIEQVTFCRCTGLRLNELRNIRGSDLYFDEFGCPWLSVTKGTKGGRKRLTKLYGSPEELEICVSLCHRAKDNKVFPHINKHANTHGYRAQYCQRVYDTEKRDISTLPFSEKVYCRKDKRALFMINKPFWYVLLCWVIIVMRCAICRICITKKNRLKF